MSKKEKQKEKKNNERCKTQPCKIGAILCLFEFEKNKNN